MSGAVNLRKVTAWRHLSRFEMDSPLLYVIADTKHANITLFYTRENLVLHKVQQPVRIKAPHRLEFTSFSPQTLFVN